MARFRKKPVEIEAVQWTGDNREAVFAWLRPREGGSVYYVGEADKGSRLAVETLEGKTFADPGHWIIRGVKGELYPCAPDIFAATYDVVDAPSPVGGADPRLDAARARLEGYHSRMTPERLAELQSYDGPEVSGEIAKRGAPAPTAGDAVKRIKNLHEEAAGWAKEFCDECPELPPGADDIIAILLRQFAIHRRNFERRALIEKIREPGEEIRKGGIKIISKYYGDRPIPQDYLMIDELLAALAAHLSGDQP